MKILHRMIALCGIALISAQSVVAQETVVLRADSWAPFNAEPESEHPGYVMEIAQKIFHKHGIKVDYKLVPWTRAVKDVESGKIDGIICTDKQESPDLIFPEEAQALLRYNFLTLKGKSWKYTGLDSLKTLRLGIPNGYVFGSDTFGNDIDKYFQNQNGKGVEYISGDAPARTAAHLLMKGRLDAYLDSPEVFFAALQSAGLKKEDFAVGDQVGPEELEYIAFTPKRESSKRFAKILSDGIRDLRSSGDLKKILDSYGVSDWK